MRKFILFACFTLIVIGGCYQWLFVKRDFFEHYSSYVMYPVLVLQHRLVQPVKRFFVRRETAAHMHRQFHQMQEERDQLLAQNIELNSLIDYAQEVKELLEFKKRYAFESCILAQVLAKNFSEQSHFYLIDKGEQAGVHVDMVALYNNCLIGKVIEVYPYYSKVLLITDQQCKIAACTVSNRATGIYQGLNQDWSAQLMHVSHLSPVEEGELVISSGDGLIFPRGFALGKIRSYKTDGLFHAINLELLVDLRLLSQCFIVQKGEYKGPESDNHMLEQELNL